jgi:hypothetical protein
MGCSPSNFITASVAHSGNTVGYATESCTTVTNFVDDITGFTHISVPTRLRNRLSTVLQPRANRMPFLNGAGKTPISAPGVSYCCKPSASHGRQDIQRTHGRVRRRPATKRREIRSSSRNMDVTVD